MEMDILNAKDCFAVAEELLDFNLDEEIEGNTSSKGDSPSSSSSVEYSHPAAAPAPVAFGRQALPGSFPEVFVEEDLEWLSNKDAFPGVETCFGILSDNPELIMKHHSPKSVLENSTSSSNNNTNSTTTVASCCDSFKVPTNHPVRPRTKRRRRRRVVFGDTLGQQCLWSNQVNFKNKTESLSLPLHLPLKMVTNSGSSIGRRCLHCQAEKTPQWRAGPLGPKTLCNACGVRYKSGRLLPEYRPASSPTFSSVLHSNSHRKVVEMRKQKQVETGAGEGTMTG